MKLRHPAGAARAGAALALVASVLGGVLLFPARSAYAIEGGEPADQVTTQFAARLDIDTGLLGGHETCTGSLVSPKLVLTAAHCVISYRPSDWTVTFGYGTRNFEKPGVFRVYTYSSNHGDSMNGAADDLAVVELKNAVSDRQPVRLDTDINTVSRAQGAWMTILGYGYFKDGNLVYTIKRGGQLFYGAPVNVSTIDRARTNPPGLLFSMDPGYDKAGEVPSGRCMRGDSGGPLLYNRPSGDSVLLGVMSKGGPARAHAQWQCVYTRVDNGDPYRTWLDSMIAVHGG